MLPRADRTAAKTPAIGQHVMYVEMNTGFPSNALGSDGIHPNDDIGYPWMGDNWYAAIMGYLH